MSNEGVCKIAPATPGLLIRSGPSQQFSSALYSDPFAQQVSNFCLLNMIFSFTSVLKSVFIISYGGDL